MYIAEKVGAVKGLSPEIEMGYMWCGQTEHIGNKALIINKKYQLLLFLD